MEQHMRNIAKSVLPGGSRRRVFAGRIKQKIIGSQTYSYQQWIKQSERWLFSGTAESLIGITYTPTISIILPCYNTPKRYFDQLLHSVTNQLYPNWQLCIADGSIDKKTSNYIESRCAIDKRISYKKVGKNLGISGNTNSAIRLATGQYIAFMDHDDTLSPYALAEVVLALNKDPKLDLIYSDEDKLSESGKDRLLPFFKPDWSPEMLLGVNYITHFVVVRRTIVTAVGNLNTDLDGAQDYDFLLRVTEKTSRIYHIPKILYHWRLAKGSTAANVAAKNYADKAGHQSLAAAIKRRKIKAEAVAVPNRPTNNRIRYFLPAKQPLVSIIIPFKDKPQLLKQCVGSILRKTTYENYELILVSNNSTKLATHRYLEQLRHEKHCKVFIWDQPFNFSKINNYGRRQANGEYLVLLNNDTKVLTPTWLEELIGVASQPHIGAVGPLLYYPNKTIQHAGVILGMKTMAGHVFRHRRPFDWTDFGTPSWPRNYLAVTGACLAVKADRYDKVGGLDEVITVAGSDVTFCISLYQKGYRNVYWPFVELIHYESISVGTYNNGIQLDYDRSLEVYRPYLNWQDPYFNMNLDLMNEQIGLRRNYE